MSPALPALRPYAIFKTQIPKNPTNPIKRCLNEHTIQFRGDIYNIMRTIQLCFVCFDFALPLIRCYEFCCFVLICYTIGRLLDLPRVFKKSFDPLLRASGKGVEASRVSIAKWIISQNKLETNHIIYIPGFASDIRILGYINDYLSFNISF